MLKYSRFGVCLTVSWPICPLPTGCVALIYTDTHALSYPEARPAMFDVSPQCLSESPILGSIFKHRRAQKNFSLIYIFNSLELRESPQIYKHDLPVRTDSKNRSVSRGNIPEAKPTSDLMCGVSMERCLYSGKGRINFEVM